MTDPISFQYLPLLGEGEGHLVMAGGKVAAVVSRLDGGDQLAEHRGRWFIEAGFGACTPEVPERLFQSLEQVSRWVAGRLSPRSDHCCGGCSG